MKKLWIYLLVAFGLGWLLQGAGMLLGGVWFTVCNALCMFAPLLATLTACGSLKTDRCGVRWRLGLKSYKLGWWFAALWGPAVVSVAGAALFFLLFPARFDPTMGALSASLGTAGAAVPQSTLTLMIVSLAEALTWAPFLNMIFAAGEECGWRGFLAPFLCGRLGRTKGLLLTGVIWGAWHWPIVCLAGYNYGTGYPGAPFTGALTMCLSCVALGVLLSFLYDRTQSIWAPALCHGAFNAAAGLGTVFLAEGTTSLLAGPTPLGLVAGIPLFALAVWALFAGPKKTE